MRLPSPVAWLHFSLALMVSMLFTGCHHRPVVYNKNINQAATVDPSVYTVGEYNNDKNAYSSATDLTMAKLKRNDIVWGLMTDIEIVYNSQYKKLFGGKNLTNVIGDSLTLGLGAAGSIATHAATKTIFAALSTGITGLNLSISKNYFAEQSFQVIGIAMQTRRDKIRAGIQAGLAQDVTAYPLNQARRDLMTYIQAGTLAAGLQELQEEAGAATAAIKTPVPTTPPSAPSTPLVNIGVVQNALTWSAVMDATSYTVYWANTTGVTKSSSKINAVTANDVVHSGLDSTKTYHYAVSASNAAGESALSGEASAQPVATAVAPSANLPAPTNVRVQMTNSAAVITFDAPPGAATFNVYKDPTGTATTTNRIFTGKSSNLYVDTAADASKSFYSVVAVDINGAAGAQSVAVSPKAATPAVPPQLSQFQLH